ncbi:MAG: hypothetical protein LBM99_01700 [Bacillales bacterium]|jgi:predicted small secreted protein|nr:hypothetical protein [Bacillales bacterium]
MRKTILLHLLLSSIFLLSSCSNTVKIGFEISSKPMGTPAMFVAYETAKSTKKEIDISLYFGHACYFSLIDNELVFNTNNDMVTDTDPWNLFGYQIVMNDKVIYSGKLEDFRENGELDLNYSPLLYKIKSIWKLDPRTLELEKNTAVEITIGIVSVDSYEELTSSPLFLLETAKGYGVRSLFIHRKNTTFEFFWRNLWEEPKGTEITMPW